MTENNGTIKNVSWRDLCPWFVIFRAFYLAVSPSVLFLAFIGALITPIGWTVGNKIFVGDELEVKATAESDDEDLSKSFAKLEALNPDSEAGRLAELKRIATFNATCPCTLGVGDVDEALGGASLLDSYLPRTWYTRFVAPFENLFLAPNLSWFACMLFGGIWTILVWGFFGAAISRIAVMQLGREERVGIREALGHASRKYLAYVSGPLLPLMTVALIAIPTVILGLIMMADIGVILAGLAWPLVLLGSFIIAFILLGLAFGWPLMWSTVSAEGTDAFDGLSRAYAYTFQRPLHYLFYGFVLISFGMVCWFVVQFFTESVIDISYWNASWGANLTDGVDGSDRIADIESAVSGVNNAGETGDGLTKWRVNGFGPHLIYFFNACVYGLAAAFSYSYFWCAFAAIYLVLRLNVDQTEFDEVWIEEDEEPYGLPPVKPDDAGVPDLADKSKESNEKQDDEKPDTIEYESSPSDGVKTNTDGEETPDEDDKTDDDSDATTEASDENDEPTASEESTDEPSDDSDDEEDNEKLESDS